MKLDQLLENLPDFAVDIKINAKNLLDSRVLTKKQVMIIFVACAFATKNETLFNAVLESASSDLNEQEITAGKISATLMSMTSVYYNFTQLVSNQEYSKMPTGLRMNAISPAKHGIDECDFRLASIAVSVLNGSGIAMDSHEKILKQHDVESIKIKEAVKIASIVNSLKVLI